MSKRMSKTVLTLALGSVLALALTSVALATHPRPGGGTPFRTPLVPAFKECVNSNSFHVAPLAFGSCTPPVLDSAIIRTGIGNMVGSARLDVLCTDGQSLPCNVNAGDQEDIKVVSSATDAICVAGGVPGCSAAGADYTGTVLGQSLVRITDHSNGVPAGTVCANGTGAAPCGTATMTDIVYSVVAGCADNGGAGGGTCSVSTTIDTQVPTTVKELPRTSRYSESASWTRARTAPSARAAASPARRSVAPETRHGRQTRASSPRKGPEEANLKHGNGSGASRSRSSFRTRSPL
jgi:hypothetical protein